MLWQKEYNASKETGTLPAKYAKRREKRKDFPFNFSVSFAYLAGKILSCHAACHICGKVATHVGSQVATFPVAG